MKKVDMAIAANGLEQVLLQIIKQSERVDLHNNGALIDLVPPYLINEAKTLLGVDE